MAQTSTFFPRVTSGASLNATVIGAGPAGLMAAEQLASHGVSVQVFDRMASPARKLLMAGIGGLNLTHDEPVETLLDRYGPARARLEPAIRAFPPAELRRWCEDLGQPTFTGTSGRVFPRAMKASGLVRAWLGRLGRLGVRFHPRQRWLGWSDDAGLMFDTQTVRQDGAVVLALGGASWPRLGSDGAWTSAMPPEALSPFKPSNCGFRVGWSGPMARHAGTPLKRVTARFAGRQAAGDAMITAAGIEGGPFYSLSAPIRDAIAADGSAIVELDLRPDLDHAELARRLTAPRRGQSLSTFLRKTAGLSPAAITLLHEASGAVVHDVTARIKAMPLQIAGTTGIDRAISTAGGLRFEALHDWQIRPGVFVAGEMLDWEAPTGGYLLQAAFSTGYAAGQAACAYLGAALNPPDRSAG